jgi:quercetin dioxygenase-like cupin family protein
MIDSVSDIIIRYHRDGDRLDVAGLNQITVLVDRSQTAMTEIGWNVWYAGLEGPPHYHDEKEQLFVITEGTGTVTVGENTYRVGPNHLVHVPQSVMHRTEVDPGQPLAYLLYNAFKDSHKEGHASFAAHIEEAKHERRQQADAASRGATIDWTRVQKPGVHMVLDDMTGADASVSVPPLLEPPATQRCVVELVSLLPDGEYVAGDMEDGEVTLFMVSGTSVLITARQDYRLDQGYLAYLPAGTTAIVRAGSAPVRFLSCTTLLS